MSGESIAAVTNNGIKNFLILSFLSFNKKIKYKNNCKTRTIQADREKVRIIPKIKRTNKILRPFLNLGFLAKKLKAKTKNAPTFKNSAIRL